jgi:hypothetical protein
MAGDRDADEAVEEAVRTSEGQEYARKVCASTRSDPKHPAAKFLPDPKPRIQYSGKINQSVLWFPKRAGGAGQGEPSTARKGRSNEEMMQALRQVESGEKVTEVCRLGISENRFYRRKEQSAGLGLSELRELRSRHRQRADSNSA